MPMETYIEVGVAEKKENQKKINSAVSMLVKTFRVGTECKY